MTWQKFYEQWSLYGEDENVWKDYKNNISSFKQIIYSTYFINTFTIYII